MKDFIFRYLNKYIIAVDNLWNKGPVLKVVKCPAAKHVLKVH